MFGFLCAGPSVDVDFSCNSLFSCHVLSVFYLKIVLGCLEPPISGGKAGTLCLDAFLVLISACPLLRVTQRRNVIPVFWNLSWLSTEQPLVSVQKVLKHSHGSKPNLHAPADWDGADPGKCWRPDYCASSTQLVLWWDVLLHFCHSFRGKARGIFLIQLLPCSSNYAASQSVLRLFCSVCIHQMMWENQQG